MSTVVDVLVTLVLFIVVLGGIVLFHELGHFITARLARVRVLEFGVGFPPRAKVLAEGRPSPEDVALVARRRQEALEAAKDDPELRELLLDQEPERARGTLYTLNWLPIGGFVKLEGEDGDGADDPHSFARASLLVKLLILAAGVFMNLLLSLVIFGSIAAFASPYVGLRVGGLDPTGPAAAAGIQPGDAILTLDGTRYDYISQNHGGPNILEDLRAHAGQTVTIGVRTADGRDTTVTLTLRTPAEVAANKGALGITPDKGGFQLVYLGDYTGRPLPEAAGIAWSETTRWFGLILDGLGSLAGSIVKDPTAAPPVSGPVGIATSLGDTFRNSGLVMTIYVAGILSANLALVNVLPFPPLDGGRMFVILLKAIPRYGRRISLRAEQFTYAIGFMALFAFLIWITVFDIARGVTGGGAP